MNSTSSKALEYVVRGFSVIAVKKNGKVPAGEWRARTEKALSEDEIDTEFARPCNVGIVTGKVSGITVVDIDTKNGGSVDPSRFPETYTVRTPSGGWHLYYQYSDAVHTCANQFPAHPYVDIRNDGGFVVAPPSSIDGKAYEIVKQIPLAPFPVDMFKSPRKAHRGIGSLTKAAPGTRNETITAAIGTLLATTKEDTWAGDVWKAVQDINQTYSPPLPEKELRATFDSIAKRESAKRLEEQPSPLSPMQLSVDERIEIKLRKSRSGVVFKDMVNALLVLQQHPMLNDKIRFNTFRYVVEYNGEPLTESKLLEIQSLMQDRVLPGIAKTIVDDAVQKYAFDNPYDEALTWVKSLEWDGKKRLDDWLTRATNVDATAYHRGVGAQWLLGMMRRLVKPGCIFDHVLVLVGPQGVGKTSLFRILGGDWYKTYTGAFDTKDFYLSLNGALIVDLDEGVAMYKNESIKMKTIVTQTVDEYRAPYARRTERYPRRFVFSMSTNDIEPFRDSTGNRRYWPVDVKDKFDFAWLEKRREQLFAEAYHAVTNGLEHEYAQVSQEDAELAQTEHLPEDEWTAPISDWLRESKKYREGDPDFKTTVNEIFTAALKGKIDHLERRHEMRVGAILRDLGLERRRMVTDGERRYFYMLTEKTVLERQENPLTNGEW